MVTTSRVRLLLVTGLCAVGLVTASVHGQSRSLKILLTNDDGYAALARPRLLTSQGLKR